MNARAHLPRLLAALALAMVTVTAVPPATADPGEGGSASIVDDERLITAGNLHTCAVLDTGGVRCWGTNDHGELGNNTRTTSTVPVVVSDLSAVLQLSAGGSHTCALQHAGGVKCWGLNGNGQLGNASTDDALKPVPVSGITGATQIASGGFHSCAILAAGTVSCWGQDAAGQVGDDDPGDFSSTPVPVQGTTGTNPARKLALGGSHSCALLDDGAVKCWGDNAFGQLGDGTTTNRATATAVAGLPADASAITAGESHTCALMANAERSTYCWGHNAYGQLGHTTPVSDNGTPADSSDDFMSPSPVPLKVRFDADPSPLAEDIHDLTNGRAVTSGQYHSCALLDGGNVRCWGNNQRGQLGADPLPSERLEDSVYALPVPGLGTATAVTAGGFHSCALSGSTMRCWGYNFHGQLGGFRSANPRPVKVTAVTGASKVAAGTEFACALVDTATLAQPMCWGSNANGRLGAGLSVTNTTVRVPVGGLGTVDSIDAGNGHACVLETALDTPKCWGRGGDGQLGNAGTGDQSSPVAVSGLSDATQVNAGGGVGSSERGLTCARRTTGRAVCWGRNLNGQVGDGTNTDRSSPAVVQIDTDPDPDDVVLADLTNVSSVAAGAFHACARISGGTVRCWGFNGNGELGDNTFTSRDTAVVVQQDDDPDVNVPLTNVVALAAGDGFTCALRDSGEVRCWGEGGAGQLGDESNSVNNEADKVVRTSNEVGPVTNLSNANLIAAGDNHACARRTDGSLVCWGEGGAGQLGVGSTSDSNKGVVVYPAPEKAEAIPFITSLAASRFNTCVRIIDTTVECFGSNSQGQLGDGIGPQSMSPVDVVSGPPVAGNHIPDPKDDTITTTPGNPVDVDMLANDTDPDGDSLTVVSVGTPTNGSAVDNGDGTATYTPDAGFCGDDAFVYEVTDGTATVPAVVHVEMNCAPTAVKDTATTSEDTPKDIAVLANDTDPDDDSLTVTAVTQPVHGTVAINGDNTVKYTPTADFCSPPVDTFTYTIDDGRGHTVIGGVDVTVSCSNDGPVANPDAVSTPEDTPADFDVLANDTDADGNNLTITSVSTPSHGTASTNGARVHYVPANDYSGPDSFTYKVSDGTVESTGTVTLTVGTAADAPRANNDAKTTLEDTAVLVDVLANDVEPDGDTMSIQAVGDPPHGTAVEESGKVKYTPDPHYCGSDMFTYVVSDGGLTDTASVDVAVTCVNDPPVAVDDTETTPEDTEVHVHVLTNDVDVDGDTMKVTGATGASHGTLTHGDNSVTYNPEPQFCGSDSFTYTVADSSGVTDTGTVTVTVTCVNDPVEIGAVADQTTPWGQALTVPLTASDVDPGDTLTFSLVSGPAGSSASDTGAGTFSWAPAANQIGTHNVTVRVSDGTASDDATFQVVVTKRTAALTYTGASGGQYSDSATVSAVLTDAVNGNPIEGRTIAFDLGASSVSGTTDASGQAAKPIPLQGPVGDTTVGASFAGDNAYQPASFPALQPFTVSKENLSVRMLGGLTQTDSTSGAVTLEATLAEEADGAFGSLSGVNVTFKALDGTTFCSAVATSTGPGAGKATCSAGNRSIGSTPVLVSLTSALYAGNADVGVFTVANVTAGSGAGAGRVGADAFGFQAKPGAKKSPPSGDAVHVYVDGTTANVVHSMAPSALSVSCTTGKTKICSAHLVGGSATTTPIDLTSGTVGAPTGVSTIMVDATDTSEPGTNDTYAVGITGTTTYSLGNPSAQVIIGSGNVRVL